GSSRCDLAGGGRGTPGRAASVGCYGKRDSDTTEIVDIICVMEPEVRERFERIESILHAMAVRGNEIERRDKERHEEAMARMDKLERTQEGVHKLLATGAKMMIEAQQEQRVLRREVRELTADIKELKNFQKEFLKSFRNGRNGGNGHKKSS